MPKSVDRLLVLLAELRSYRTGLLVRRPAFLILAEGGGGVRGSPQLNRCSDYTDSP